MSMLNEESLQHQKELQCKYNLLTHDVSRPLALPHMFKYETQPYVSKGQHGPVVVTSEEGSGSDSVVCPLYS